jgi:hypothetical protein
MAVEKYPFPALDPSGDSQIILAVGRKGSGKSQSAREFFRQWPGVDRLVIDINGDADPGDDMQPINLPNPLPTRLPDRPDDARSTPRTYRWVANPAASTFADDIDRALGLALYPKDREILTWVDEAGEVFKAGQVGPNGRTLLHQNRHYNAPLLLCCPRPKGIDPLCISQADRVLMYDVPHPLDRERLAENMGILPRVLNKELDETARRGKWWFTMFVAEERQLYRCPPLPIS